MEDVVNLQKILNILRFLNQQLPNCRHLADVRGGGLRDGGPEVHPDVLQPPPDAGLLVLEHVGDPVEVPGEVESVQTDHVPVRLVQETLHMATINFPFLQMFSK